MEMTVGVLLPPHRTRSTPEREQKRPTHARVWHRGLQSEYPPGDQCGAAHYATLTAPSTAYSLLIRGAQRTPLLVEIFVNEVQELTDCAKLCAIAQDAPS